MKLYFENSYGEERVIAEVADEKEAFKEIHKFCEERNLCCDEVSRTLRSSFLRTYTQKDIDDINLKFAIFQVSTYV